MSTKVKFTVAITTVLFIALIALYKSARTSQESRLTYGLMKYSVLLGAALKYDRTRRLDDAPALGNARLQRVPEAERPSELLSLFENKELNENSVMYKESVSRAVDLMDKKHTLEEKIRNARWYKRDGWWQEIQDARQELEPLSIELTNSLRDARTSGAYATTHLSRFIFPATETDLGITRNSFLRYSAE